MAPKKFKKPTSTGGLTQVSGKRRRDHATLTTIAEEPSDNSGEVTCEDRQEIGDDDVDMTAHEEHQTVASDLAVDHAEVNSDHDDPSEPLTQPVMEHPQAVRQSAPKRKKQRLMTEMFNRLSGALEVLGSLTEAQRNTQTKLEEMRQRLDESRSGSSSASTQSHALTRDREAARMKQIQMETSGQSGCAGFTPNQSHSEQRSVRYGFMG